MSHLGSEDADAVHTLRSLWQSFQETSSPTNGPSPSAQLLAADRDMFLLSLCLWLLLLLLIPALSVLLSSLLNVPYTWSVLSCPVTAAAPEDLCTWTVASSECWHLSRWTSTHLSTRLPAAVFILVHRYIYICALAKQNKIKGPACWSMNTLEYILKFPEISITEITD